VRQAAEEEPLVLLAPESPELVVAPALSPEPEPPEDSLLEEEESFAPESFADPLPLPFPARESVL
jgi:hypothetical protein